MAEKPIRVALPLVAMGWASGVAAAGGRACAASAVVDFVIEALEANPDTPQSPIPLLAARLPFQDRVPPRLPEAVVSSGRRDCRKGGPMSVAEVNYLAVLAAAVAAWIFGA